MHSFALLGLLASSLATGVTADLFKREHPKQIIPSPVDLSFNGPPPSALPSGTGVPKPIPTGGQGSGPPLFQCHPVDPPAVGTPKNPTLTPIPSGPVPSQAPTIPIPTGVPGSGTPAYTCHPVDPSAVPSGAPKDKASKPIPSGPAPTDVPPAGATPPVPTSGQGSKAPILICYPTGSSAVPGGDPKDGTPKDGGPKDAAPKDAAPKDNAPKDGTPKDAAPKNAAPTQTTCSGPAPTSTPPAGNYN